MDIGDLANSLGRIMAELKKLDLDEQRSRVLEAAGILCGVALDVNNYEDSDDGDSQ